MRVAVIGCGLIGHKRAQALGEDELVACYDVDAAAAQRLAAEHGGAACRSLDELLAAGAEVVVVATPHDRLADGAVRALEAGAHVLVEKPAGIGVADVDRIAAAAAARHGASRSASTIASTRGSRARSSSRGRAASAT